MRISITAGGSSSRPDTLKQTGSAANLDKPLADGAGHTFICFDSPLVLSRMARPRAHVGKAELLEKLADVALMIVDVEALGDDALKVNPAPSHDAVGFPVRTHLDDLRQLIQLFRRQARRRTIRPVVEEPIRPSDRHLKLTRSVSELSHPSFHNPQDRLDLPPVAPPLSDALSI